MKECRKILRRQPRYPLKLARRRRSRASPDGIVQAQRRRGLDEDVRCKRFGCGHCKQPDEALVSRASSCNVERLPRRTAVRGLEEDDFCQISATNRPCRVQRTDQAVRIALFGRQNRQRTALVIHGC